MRGRAAALVTALVVLWGLPSAASGLVLGYVTTDPLGGSVGGMPSLAVAGLEYEIPSYRYDLSVDESAQELLLWPTTDPGGGESVQPSAVSVGGDYWEALESADPDADAYVVGGIWRTYWRSGIVYDQPCYVALYGPFGRYASGYKTATNPIVVDGGSYEYWAAGSSLLPAGGTLKAPNMTIVDETQVFTGVWETIVLARREGEGLSTFLVEELSVFRADNGYWQIARASASSVTTASIDVYELKNGISYTWDDLDSGTETLVASGYQDARTVLLCGSGGAALDSASADALEAAMLGVTSSSLLAADLSVDATIGPEPASSEVPESVLADAPLLDDVSDWFGSFMDRVSSAVSDLLWFLRVWVTMGV